jgi:hypothetical protein
MTLPKNPKAQATSLRKPSKDTHRKLEELFQANRKRAQQPKQAAS